MIPRLAASDLCPTDAMKAQFGQNFYYILYHNEVDGKGTSAFSGPADREYWSAAGEFHDRMFRNIFKEEREATGLARLKRLFWRTFFKPSPLRSAGGMVG